MQECNNPVEAAVSETTVLALPRSVVSFFVPAKSRTVLIAEKRGNWIVVDDKQLRVYEMLSQGKSVGEVLHSIPPSETDGLLTLLSQIFARSFFAGETESISSPDLRDSVFVYLTYACNLACSHCYMFNANNREEPLTLAEYENLFDAFSEQGIKSVTFSGGEPLLHPDFCALVTAAKDRAFSITVLSNGTKWNEELIGFAKDHIDEVQISIDGIDEDSCSRVRGPNVFNMAVETAVALANAGILTSVATTPVGDTIGEIERGYIEFSRNLARRTEGKIVFRIASKLLDGRTCGHSDSFAAIAEKLANQIYTENKCRSFSINHPPNVGLLTCGWGNLAFSPDGYAYPCNRVSDCATLGSVRRTSIDELFRKATELMAAADVDHTEPCRSCALRYLCGGGCRLDEFEKISSSLGCLSIRNRCSSDKKRRILETMIETTDFLYSFGRSS